MKILTSTLTIIAIALITTALSFLYIRPVITALPKVAVLNISTLEQARNYYTILSSSVSFIVGVLGLVLGFFYYRNKQKNDGLVASIERKRKRLNDLIECIGHFDELVDALIHNRFSNANELKHLRNRISRKFEIVVIMLRLNKQLLGLNNEEVKTIPRLNSFVEQNDILMHIAYKQIDEALLLTVKDKYIDLIQDAREVCYKNAC